MGLYRYKQMKILVKTMNHVVNGSWTKLCRYHGLYQDFHLFIPVWTCSVLFYLMDYYLLQSSCIQMLEFSCLVSGNPCQLIPVLFFFFVIEV